MLPLFIKINTKNGLIVTLRWNYSNDDENKGLSYGQESKGYIIIDKHFFIQFDVWSTGQHNKLILSISCPNKNKSRLLAKTVLLVH